MVEILLPLANNQFQSLNEIKGVSPISPEEWMVVVRSAGSHYIYEKGGKREPVPYHGSKEMGEGLRKKLTKKMGLK